MMTENSKVDWVKWTKWLGVFDLSLSRDQRASVSRARLSCFTYNLYLLYMSLLSHIVTKDQ